MMIAGLRPRFEPGIFRMRSSNTYCYIAMFGRKSPTTEQEMNGERTCLSLYRENGGD